jgi:hypothetical protein
MFYWLSWSIWRHMVGPGSDKCVVILTHALLQRALDRHGGVIHNEIQIP